ncbi:MAG: HAMP domain-containing methyl-accepting chemotaxis protein [Pseudomonadota bacterium]
MTMMKVQEEREDKSVPAFALDEMTSDPGAPAESWAHTASLEAPEKPAIFDRFAFIRNKSIAAKINAVFGAVVALGLTVVLVTAITLTGAYERYGSTVETQRASAISSDLLGTLGELRYNTSRYLFEQGDTVLQRQRAAYTQAGEKLGALDAIAAEYAPSLSPQVTQLSRDLDAYNAAFETAIEERSAAGRTANVQNLTDDVSDRGAALFADAQGFAKNAFTLSEQVREARVEYTFSNGRIAGVLTLLAGLVLVAGFFYLSRDLARKIREITRGMTRLANGDRDFEIEGDDRKDEIGEMLRALAMFKRANQQLELWARERSEHAEREIRAEQERLREREETQARRSALIADVADSFERTVGEVVGSVTAASSELHSTATRMAESADLAAGRTQELTESMAEANAGATAAAAASDEFALSIGEISRQAASSSELARLATDATTEADTTISALSASANEVGHVVELIQTIAQRTNLLALNASIEAARGGEAGRGFAVVASEVKELAMQTSRATEQVAEQIRAMQDTTGASVTALRAIAGQVKELETTAVSIASAVDQQSVAGQDLARSIDMAARGTEQVSGHIADVRELSLSTGAAAGQVLTSANDLDQQAATLNSQVQAFLAKVRAS